MSNVKSKKLNILESIFYSKLLIFIILGFNTYKKIKRFRRELENKKLSLAESNICLQLKVLKEAGYIKEDNVKRKYNEKQFIPVPGTLSNLFITYLKGKHLAKIQEEECLQKDFSQMIKEPRQWIEMDNIAIDESFIWVFSHENLSEYNHILQNPSLELQVFIEKNIIHYLNMNVNLNWRNLLSRPFKEHFDQIVKSIVYYQIVERVRGNVTSKKKLCSEKRQFLELCLLLDRPNPISSSTLRDMVRNH